MRGIAVGVFCCGLAVLLASGLGCEEAQWNWGATQKAEADAPAEKSQGDSFAVPGSTFSAQTARATQGSGGATASGESAGDGVIVLRVHFDVLRVDIPVDALRHSQKIWNHLDETQGDPSLTALLARNGFRVGVGGPSDWPAIRTIFELNGARVARIAHTAQEEIPLTLPLGPVKDGAGYFLHKRGGGLDGGTFSDGLRTFRIGYELTLEDEPRVTLRAIPVYQESKAEEKRVARDGDIITVKDRGGRVFDELAVDRTLSPGEYLVIGGSAPAEKGFVLGSWWLDATLNNQAFETVICISAQATRIE